MEADLNIDSRSRTAQLKLGGNLSIRHASELKEVLLNALEQADTTLLDLEEVEVFDLSSIQLLYAFYLAGSNCSRQVRLSGECPEYFRLAVEGAGFSKAKWLCFGNSG